MNILLMAALTGFVLSCACLIAASISLGKRGRSGLRDAEMSDCHESLETLEELQNDLQHALRQEIELERLNLQQRVDTLN
jgi:hypothetical protein